MSDECLCDFPLTCGGMGFLQCEGCGGDQCVCACGGELECDGRPECYDDDNNYDAHDGTEGGG